MTIGRLEYLLLTSIDDGKYREEHVEGKYADQDMVTLCRPEDIGATT